MFLYIHVDDVLSLNNKLQQILLTQFPTWTFTSKMTLMEPRQTSRHLNTEVCITSSGRVSEWKGALHPSNEKRLYTDEWSTEKGKIIEKDNRKVKGRKR